MKGIFVFLHHGANGKRVPLLPGDDVGLDQSGKKLYPLRDHVQDSESKGFLFHFWELWRGLTPTSLKKKREQKAEESGKTGHIYGFTVGRSLNPTEGFEIDAYYTSGVRFYLRFLSPKSLETLSRCCLGGPTAFTCGRCAVCSRTTTSWTRGNTASACRRRAGRTCSSAWSWTASC